MAGLLAVSAAAAMGGGMTSAITNPNAFRLLARNLGRVAGGGHGTFVNLGDSLRYGTGSRSKRTGSIPYRLVKRLQKVLGDGGPGFVPISESASWASRFGAVAATPRWTLGGVSAFTGRRIEGIGLSVGRIDAGANSWAFTTTAPYDTASLVEVVGYANGWSAAAPIVGSGGTVFNTTMSYAAIDTPVRSAPIVLTPGAGNVITLSPGADKIWASGAWFYNPTGLTGGNIAYHGSRMDAGAGVDQGLWVAGNTKGFNANLSFLAQRQPGVFAGNPACNDAVGFMCNYNTNDFGGGIGLAIFEAGVRAMAAWVAALPYAVPLIWILEPASSAAAALVAGVHYSDYHDIVKQVASEYPDFFGVIDKWALVGFTPHGAGAVGGYWFDRGRYLDGTHYEDPAHADDAKTEYEIIRYFCQMEGVNI